MSMINAIAGELFSQNGPIVNPQYQPPQRIWRGLTDKDYQELHLQMGPTYFYQDYGRAIEAKLKELNS
jgi:hypothetical protein